MLTKSPTANIVAIARSKDDLDLLVKKYGLDRVGIVVGDVSETSTSKSAVDLAIKKFGSINSVILNAGVLSPVNPIAKAEIEKWKTLFDINFFAPLDLIQQSLPHLRESHGNVIAVLSGASTSAYFGWGAYGASKAALNHLIQSLVAEEPEISAISVAPGVVNTAMQADIRDVFGANMTKESLQKFVDLHKNDQLLPPEIPATIYANLALNGWGKELNGKYLRYNDANLESYLK